MENLCIFKWKFHCDQKKDLTEAGPTRIETIICFSKQYNDHLHTDLEKNSGTPAGRKIYCHRSCVSTYTSQQHLKRHQKRKSTVQIENNLKKKRRSNLPSFRFDEQCIFCRDECNLSKDKKHPDRWRKAMLFRTACASPGKKAFKQSILEVCAKRSDEIADQVRIRIKGALSDLHAADARYHVDCMTCFMSPRSISAAKNRARDVEDDIDSAFDLVIDEMVKDRSRLWNSIELYHQYQLFGGKALLRRSFLKKIKDRLMDEIAILTSPGLASLVVFSKGSSLHLASDSEDKQDDDVIITRLAKSISAEIMEFKPDKSRYDIRVSKENMMASVSPMLMNLLLEISGNLDGTLPALLIGNIVTSVFFEQANASPVITWKSNHRLKDLVKYVLPVPSDLFL